MMQFQRQQGGGKRPVAVLGAAAVAVGALVPGALPASASSHVQDLAPACDGFTDPVGFRDIAFLASPTQDAINCAYGYEITKGRVDAEIYAPVDVVKRYEMALFISRAVDVIEVGAGIDVVDTGDAAAAGFTDLAGVPSAARAAIDRLAELEIVYGKSSSSYDPFGPVNRRDMARFINRVQSTIVAQAVDGAEYDAANRTTTFPDVPDLMKGSEDIYAIQSAGIVQGHSSGLYKPFEAVRRDHMALYLMRHIADNIEAGNLFWFEDDEAVDGFTGDVSVEYVDKEWDVFGDLDTSFWFDDTDVFTVDGKTASFSAFKAALSSGDEVHVRSYQRDPERASHFDLSNVNPLAPALAVTGGGEGSENDATVSVTPADEHWSSVRVERAPLVGDFQELATLTADDADGNGVLRYQDDDLAPGQYRYRAFVENDGDTGPASAVVTFTAVVPTDVISPVAQSVGFLDERSSLLALDLADVFYIAFDESIQEPVINSSIEVKDGDGTVATLINDEWNSDFTLSTVPLQLGGKEYAPGHVVLVEVLTPRVLTPGTAAGVGLPATITAQAGLRDANGVKWDIATSIDLEIQPLS